MPKTRLDSTSCTISRTKRRARSSTTCAATRPLNDEVDEDGRPTDGNGMTAFVITFRPVDGGRSEMSIRIHFDSTSGMDEVLATGVEEGMASLVAQIDEVLAGAAG